MTIHAASDLLADFKFFANRPTTDESTTDAQIYRLLTLAQQMETEWLAATFPGIMMTAPTLMVTADGGLTYTLSTNDEDGLDDFPFGHAELYATNPSGRELYGSTYGSPSGDFVFEGSTVRAPGGTAGSFSSGPYIRYVAVPGTLNAATEPTLKPAFARPLITYRALVMWANRGGMRDARPFQEMYDIKRQSVTMALTTQYGRNTDSALSGIRWWRHWLSNGGMTSSVVGFE